MLGNMSRSEVQDVRPADGRNCALLHSEACVHSWDKHTSVQDFLSNA